MKVVVNRCFGGFGLSDAAGDFCRDRGMSVTHYTPKGNYADPDADLCFEEEPKFGGGKYFALKGGDPAFRSNPILVAAVETLGSAIASGDCAKLVVVEIPYDSTEGWHISEYDGSESVRENHQSW